MIARFIALLPLWVCRLLGVPVSYARLFPGGVLSDVKGQILLGDTTVPATFLDGASDDRNQLRNARLAKTAWKTWTLIRAEQQYHGPIRIMYGADQVLLTKLRTGNIAVRNGAEDCRFAIIDRDGREVTFEKICRGPRESLEGGLRRWLVEEGLSFPLEDSLEDCITFV